MRILLPTLLFASLLDLGATTIVASALPGIHQNTNLATGGGTDDTAVLQAALNTAGTLTLILDGPSLITGLTVHSTTTVSCTGGGGLYLANSSNKPLVGNANRSKTTRTDHDISIGSGCTFNGNGNNQAASQQEADGTIIVGVGIFGGTTITVSDLTIKNVSAWAIMLSNVSGGTVSRITHTITPGSTRLQQDGVDVRGPSDTISISNVSTQAYDDAVALNSKTYSSGVVGPSVGGGNITGITIDQLVLDGALLGVDVISTTALVDDITITNVSGTVHNYALSISTDCVSNSGNFGTVTMDGVTAAWTGSPLNAGGCYVYNEYIRVWANISNLVLRNITYTSVARSSSAPLAPFLRVMTGITATTISATGVTWIHAAPNTGSFVQVDTGTITNLNLTNVLGGGIPTAMAYTTAGGTITNYTPVNVAALNVAMRGASSVRGAATQR